MSSANRDHLQFGQYLDDWAEDLELLRQNRLLDSRQLASFCRDRGLGSIGVSSSDSADFLVHGWLRSEGRGHDGRPLLHPFRLWVLYCAAKSSRRVVTVSHSTSPETARAYVERLTAELPPPEKTEQAVMAAARVADLCILLEPLYWPRVVGKRSMPGFRDKRDYQVRFDAYRHNTLDVVGSLDTEEWRTHHESLRIEAALLDGNPSLYMLLRVGSWNQRERLKGVVSGALWMRHMAELIRRAFEEVHELQWPEEDQAFGWWAPGGRRITYGQERPLDHVLQAKPYLAVEFGLFTGSLVRWYVEGETEYHAVLAVIPDPETHGIELINLRGSIEGERGNVALRLCDGLQQDLALRRFSMISFDMDVPAVRRVVRRQVETGNVVGLIAAHDPDFEFANFGVVELAEIAARIDESHGVSGAALRRADWTGIASGRAFEDRYKELSAMKPRSLKGKEWGQALGAYADEHPSREDDGSERAFWRSLRAALHSRFSNYDHTKEHRDFDPGTFASIERPLLSSEDGASQ